jgi:hypothetical protein
VRYLIAFFLGVFVLEAQTVLPPDNRPRKLAFVLPGILDEAVQQAETPQIASFIRTAITGNFLSINSAVATQLSNLPNPSPASAYHYEYDPESGAMQRGLRSLGPVLAERAETLGKDSLFFAVTYQRFFFDRLDDLNLGGFQIASSFTLPPGVAGPFPTDAVLIADASISIQISQVTAHFAYGLTRWMDLSYAFNMVSSSLAVRGSANFRTVRENVNLSSVPIRNTAESATGLGDGVFRVKGRFLRRKKAALAFGTDIRVPLGDEFNFHGAGAWGVKPFLIGSATFGKFSPHLNVGYQWNGESFMASEFQGQKRRIPAQGFYAAGFDVAVSPNVTFAGDFLHQMVIKGQRSLLGPPPGPETAPSIIFIDQTRHEYNGSAGLKVQFKSGLFITGNMLFRLNNAGLRARAIPLVGVSYMF